MKRAPTRVLAGALLLVALVLAGVVSHWASTSPDGLNRVAADQGFSEASRDSATAHGPLAGYHARGVGDDTAARGLAGVAGALVVLGAAGGLTYVVRRRRTGD